MTTDIATNGNEPHRSLEISNEKVIDNVNARIIPSVQTGCYDKSQIGQDSETSEHGKACVELHKNIIELGKIDSEIRICSNKLNKKFGKVVKPKLDTTINIVRDSEDCGKTDRDTETRSCEPQGSDTENILCEEEWFYHNIKCNIEEDSNSDMIDNITDNSM